MSYAFRWFETHCFSFCTQYSFLILAQIFTCHISDHFRFFVTTVITANRNRALIPGVIIYQLAGFRETAFVHAIISAGMTQAIATACRMGKLGTCGCDPSVTGEGPGYSWGGCSDNIGYGAEFAAQFMDSREKGTDIKSLMNLHNNRAGRMVGIIQYLTVLSDCRRETLTRSK